MKKIFCLKTTMILLFSLMLVTGCGGSKEVVDYEPRPDPFPQPEEEPFDGRPDVVEKADIIKEDVTEKEDYFELKPPALRTIYFEFDESRLTENGRAVLAENARWLMENKSDIVRIEGHCDERGTVEYNLALGQRRAVAVRDYLVNLGVSRNRMLVLSFGKERPVSFGNNEKAWGQNRRAEFVKL